MDTPSPSNEKVDDSTNDIVESAVGIDISANITVEATIANNFPDDEPLYPPPAAVGGTSSPAPKKLTLPETPRWRFVNKAKKTEGYSSSAAGTVVTGLSGEELAGKFIAPGWKSRENSKEEIVHAGSSEWEEERGKEERNVGKLGRLNCTEGDEVTVTSEHAVKVVEEKSEFQLCVNDDQGEELVVVVAEETPSLEGSTPMEREVSTELTLQIPVLVPSPVLLTSHDPEGGEPVLTRTSATVEDGQCDWIEKQISELGPTSAAPPSSQSSESLHASQWPAPDEDLPQRPKKTRGALSSLLLAIIAFVVVLGIILGRGKSEDGNESKIALAAVETNVPSQSPTTSCPVNTKLFSLQYTSVKEENIWTNTFPKTWVLKYACSDMEITKCLPCADTGNTSPASTSSPSSQLFFENNSTPNATTDARYSPAYSPTMSGSVLVAGLEKYMTSSDGVSGCIPDGYEYVFEVKPSDNPEECCGFLPYSFLLSYDDAAMVSDNIIFHEFEDNIQGGGRVSFPESAEPCPTSEPSGMPSATPSQTPTELPSVMPSDTPMLYPTTQPTGNPTASPTKSPSSSPTLDPSDTPTSNPTPQPTTQTPTDKPVCDANYEDFNLCIAIDMSGSVCNKGTGFECASCEPELICYDPDVGRGTCCNNFLYLIEFTKDMISTFASFVAARSFSIVPFAADAELLSDLSTANEALASLDALTYTGGSTNHAAAINLCRTSLESSPEVDRKNFLLLITDGSPSEPVFSPEAEAEAAAEEAKSEGIYIIPLMIKQEISLYLQRLSSDGIVFDASDFDDLPSLRETLLAQVECQV